MQAMVATQITTARVPVRRNRNFRRLVMGSSVSRLGTRVVTIAYPMLVLYLTGSPVTAGWVAFAASAPSFLIYIPAGALVDRCDPRRTMLLSEFGRGVAIAAVVASLATGRPSVPLLIVIAVIEETLEVFSTLAERRYVRSLVEPDQASAALARSETRTHMVVLVGRPLGGFLFGLTPILPFLSDVISFIISVCVLISIRSKRATGRAVPFLVAFISSAVRYAGNIRVCSAQRRHRPGRVHDRQLGNEIREGLHWVSHSRFARAAVPLNAGATMIAQALIMVFLAEAHTQQLSSVVVGLVLAASGGGGALGSVAASRLRGRPRRPRLQTQMRAWAVAFTFLALSGGRSVPCISIVMVILGFTGALGNIELDTYLIQNVPENMLARVMSVGCLVELGAFAVGPVIGGMLAQWHEGHGAVLWLLAMMLILTTISSLIPSMRAPLDPVQNSSKCEASDTATPVRKSLASSSS